ncbi:enoyl-CoA hydratase-related protein [Nocardioides sp. Bht2]|uniref:enoyl-CoA hydratase-related protein n=1 Tax=Nocardioides sp. Bht2 TaxID=3392297 RepID=UPI0039B6B0AC
MSSEARIETTFADGVATLRLVNPEFKNAITQQMAADMVAFCAQVAADPTIGAVVLEADGGYFCSGADTRDLAAIAADPASPDSVARLSAVYQAFVSIGTLPVPTIAMVEGGAVGAGLNLVLAVDVVVLTPDAVLDSGFLARRIHPGGGHFTLLGRSLGYQQAMAMGVLGERVSGTEAVALGLAWRTAEASEFAETARALTARAAKDPELTRRTKESATLELNNPGLSWAAAIEVERGAQMWSLGRKGTAAWATKPSN